MLLDDWHRPGWTPSGHHTEGLSCGSQNCACCRSRNPDDWMGTCPTCDALRGQPWSPPELEALALDYLYNVEHVSSDTEIVFAEQEAEEEDSWISASDFGAIMSAVQGHGNVSSEPFSGTGRRLDPPPQQTTPPQAPTQKPSKLPSSPPSPSKRCSRAFESSRHRPACSKHLRRSGSR